MSRPDAAFAKALDRLSAESVLRRLHVCDPAGAARVRRDGRILLNVSANDYLGLSCHPALIERAAEWASRYGVGAGASRLVTGTSALHDRVEQSLASFKGCEAALLFASGWQANASVLPVLFDCLSAAQGGAAPLVFTDRLNHASLHQGCQGVRQIRFRHNDLGHLEELLAARASAAGPRFILTESVFSMDGDRTDIARLAAIAGRHDAFVYLDEAHATGVLGPQGRGLSAGIAGIDCVMGTFSKAFGGFGAYVAGSRLLCDLLVNRCSGFIHTTALPPPVLGAIDAALDLLPGMDAERAHLAAMAERLRQALHHLGIGTAASSTQIVPAILGASARAVAAGEALARLGFLGVAIRPPTVPRGASRIRFALSALHSEAAIDELVSALPCMLEAA